MQALRSRALPWGYVSTAQDDGLVEAAAQDDIQGRVGARTTSSGDEHNSLSGGQGRFQ